MNDGFLGIVRLISVAIQNVGFAVVVGALMSHRWLARGETNWQTEIGCRLLVAVRAASMLSLVASMMALWAHCAVMSETTLFDAGPAVWSMLVETGFGHAWLFGALLTLCVVAMSFLWSGKGSVYPLGISVALAGVAMARSNSGHPVEAGLFTLPVWLDWLHLLAISAWVGLVFVTTYLVMPRLKDSAHLERHVSASFVKSLSDASTYALIVLFATGLVNGSRGVNTVGNLWSSIYGQLVLLKLGLVLIAAALGGHNRFFEMPKLLSALRHRSTAAWSGPLRRFGAVLHVEALILLGVLVVAAVLVSSPLPGTT